MVLTAMLKVEAVLQSVSEPGPEELLHPVRAVTFQKALWTTCINLQLQFAHIQRHFVICDLFYRHLLKYFVYPICSSKLRDSNLLVTAEGPGLDNLHWAFAQLQAQQPLLVYCGQKD